MSMQSKDSMVRFRKTIIESLYLMMIKLLNLLLLGMLITGCKQSSPSVEKTVSTAQAIVKPAPMTTPSSFDENLTLDYCMGKFDPNNDDRFVKIADKYADRSGMYLRKEAYESFKKMYSAAEASGIKLVVRSATRNFDYQRGIWERKWTGTTKLSDGVNAATDISSEKDRAKKIMNYSAMPGASRHHWGTDIDLNSFNNAYFESGKGLLIYQWLVKHAHEYGYCQPYTPKSKGRSGYNEEKWHWSYTPLSKPLTAFAAMHLHDEHFSDFAGHSTAKELSVVKNYVLGIDETCK